MESNSIHFYQDDLKILSECRICPRNCGVNRFISANGWCRTGAGYSIASIGPHYGEEPIISGKNGICNIFFSHCNLQCIFCQNHQISDNQLVISQNEQDIHAVIERIFLFLEEGCHAVGFVSPSHVVPHVKTIIKILKKQGVKSAFVYNSNGYDSVESLKSLEGLIDIYLPDFKYLDPSLASSYSGAADYPEMASLAILEMYRQKGSTLITDEEGQALSGLIIRHLVLPGHVENSKKILRFIAEELSPRVHVSLMSQYYPVYKAIGHTVLGRELFKDEYQEIIDEMDRLGLFKGWIQNLESSSYYLPDFKKDNPFESWDLP